MSLLLITKIPLPINFYKLEVVAIFSATYNTVLLTEINTVLLTEITD